MKKVFEILGKYKNVLMFGGVIVLVIVIALMSPSGDKEEIKQDETTTKNNSEFVTKKPSPIDDGFVPYLSPLALNWKAKYEGNEPSTIKYNLINKQVTNTEAIRYGRIIGYEGSEIAVDNEKLLMFKSFDSKTYYFSKLDNIVHFTKNLHGQKITFGATANEENMKNSLISVFNNINENKDVSLNLRKVEYETIMGPRFVNSEKEKAKIVKFEYGYIYKGKQVWTPEGRQLTARFKIDGELIGFEMRIPFERTIPESEVMLFSWEEIKKKEAGDIKIISINGGKEYDLSNFKVDISLATLTKIDLGYMHWVRKGKLEPYFIIEGNTWVESGPITFVAGMPAGIEL